MVGWGACGGGGGGGVGGVRWWEGRVWRGGRGGCGEVGGEVGKGICGVGLGLEVEDERSGVCQAVVFCGCCYGWFPAWRLLIYMLDFESRTKR